MKTKSVPEKMRELLSPGSEAPVSVDDGDSQFIDEYEADYSQLDEGERLLSFRNVIRKQGRCGFARGGTYDYLINTDRNGRYRVTIRTRWRSGIESGQHERAVVSEAGGKSNLGCTDSGYIPVTYYSREVVGEVRLG